VNISIERFDKYQKIESVTTHKVPEGLTLLQALQHIKAADDPTLGFKSGCRSGICGICAVRANDKEELSCIYMPKDGDLIAPLKHHEVLRDLIVDKSKANDTIKRANAWLQKGQLATITIEDEKRTELQSDCILCSSCYSACPVLAVNPDFLGPFALTRAYRYSSDPREGDTKRTIETIQTNGIWDCTLCGECTVVCPQDIDPKMDITMLRGTSSQYGYSDPNFAPMNFGFNFGEDF
jgi:fumarate reductase iron-sulfur subunit